MCVNEIEKIKKLKLVVLYCIAGQLYRLTTVQTDDYTVG